MNTHSLPAPLGDAVASFCPSKSKTTDEPLGDLLRRITEPPEDLRKLIAAVRGAKSPDAAKARKSRLQGIAWAATFEGHRRKTDLVEYSGVMPFDVDKLADPEGFAKAIVDKGQKPQALHRGRRAQLRLSGRETGG